MKVAILQQNFVVGDIEGNTNKIIKGYRKACQSGADLVVCSELALFGYPPKDLLLLPDKLAEQQRCLQRLIKEVGQIGLIVGIAEQNSGLGKPLFNTAVLIQQGKITAKWHKVLLPTYDVFDEDRYFEPGEERPFIFTYQGKRLAMLVCEDIWGDYLGSKLYKDNPLDSLVGGRLDLLVVINGSPYHWGKGNERFTVVSKVARLLKCPVVYVNQVGGNDDLVFDGRSFVVDSQGQCIGTAPPFVEDLVIVDVNCPSVCPYYFDQQNMEDLFKALVLGTRDYILKTGHSSVIVALSGGIDSAVVLCIAAAAIGAHNVTALSLPSPFSSEGSISDAKDLSRRLGVDLKIIPINQIYQSYGQTLQPFIGWHIPGEVEGDVTEENIQARIRGDLVMAFANRQRGSLVLSTGNKSELAVGYCTLYGDMVGGFAVIADLPKTLVYRLAEFINQDREVIPHSILQKPPSAELRPGQKDLDSLPPYDILDAVLDMFIEKRMAVEEIVEKGFARELVVRVIKMVTKNEYKRQQMPVGLRVTSQAFGSGWRFPIAIAARF